MPQLDVFRRQLAERFDHIVELLHTERQNGKKFDDLYTLMGCMFFAMETPYDPMAALGMRLLMKRMTLRRAYEGHAEPSFQMLFMEEVKEFLAVYPVAFPRLSDIPDRAIPDSVLEELHLGSRTAPNLPHEPREWKRKIRLSKAT